jgi:hypothetical protein
MRASVSPRALCIGLMLACVRIAAAAPSGAELLAACEHALAHGFDGIEGQMCAWYARPCDCDLGHVDAPRVCLPEQIETEALARDVAAGLRAEPALQAAPPAVAAARILAREYPCAEP